jgi:alpha-L-fucosidase
MKTNNEAIYATKASPIGTFDWGRCTQKEEKGNTILYFSVFDWPSNSKLLIPGLKNKVIKAELLASEEKLKTTAGNDGLSISLSAQAPDKIASVVKVTVKGPVAGKSSGATKKMRTGELD